MKLPTIETIIEQIANTRYLPSTIRVTCNDKLSEILFRGVSLKKPFNLFEKRNFGKKQEEIITICQVTGVNSLNEFDRAVFDVCISEQLFDNCYTTISAIFRALIGKVGDAGVILHKNQQAAVIESLKRLMTANITFKGLTDNLKKLGYIKGNQPFSLHSTNILPAVLLEEKTYRVNGNDIDTVVYFYTRSPLFDIADVKSQILRYPHELFNVPNQNNTPRIITLKSYVMRRIFEIKSHKMTPTITFDDVFKKCRIADKDSKTILRARNAIIQLFQHLKDIGEIKTFEVTKNRGAFYSVNFTF